MGAEYINPQWRLPNEKTGNNQGYSMDFNGSASITCSSVPALTSSTNFSISGWFKQTTLDVTSFMLGARSSSTDAVFLYTYNDGNMYVDVSNGSQSYGYFDYSTVISAGTWFHVAMVFDGGGSANADRLKLYINGSLITLTYYNTIPSSTTASTNDFKIGIVNGYTNEWLGGISQVSIFDYALPATGSNSIATLYGGGTPFNPMALSSPPQVYYPLGNSAHMGSNYLTPNGALQDYVFSGYPGGTKLINSNINKSNTGGKFTFSVWQKYNGSGFLTFNHGAGAVGEFRFFSNAIVYLAPAYYQYFDFSPSTAASNTNWQHWVIFVDTTNVTNSKFWVDGVPISKLGSATTTSANTFTSGLQINIGGYPLISNMMYFEDYEIDQANVDKLYGYGSPLMSTATLTQAPNAWYKLDASEIYNNSTTEWQINEATADYTSSLSFPGVVGDLLKIPNSSTFIPTSNLTLSFWVNHTLPSGSPTDRDPRVFSVPKDANSEGLYLMDDTNGTLRFTISSSAGNSDTFTAIAVNDGKWHNVVCTWDASGNIKVYTDNGTPNTNTNTGTLTIPASTDMGVGGKFTGTGSAEKFAGLISNGSVWNKALSASEVSEVYNSGQPGNLSSHSANSNLVAWWKMDNLTTGIQDSSTNSNNGTAFDLSVQPGSVSTLNGLSSGMNQTNLVQSDLLTTSSYSPYALNFDGNDYIETSGFTIGNNYTFSCWLKSDTTSPSNMCFLSSPNYYTVGYNGNFVIRFTNSTQIQMYSYNGRADSESSTVTIPSIDTNWHHFSLTSNGTTTNIYWDGSPLTVTGNQTKSLDNISQGLIIGDNITGNNNAFNGSLSNVSVWNTALTSSQVREIYNEGRPSNLNTFSGTAPVAWWQLGSNSSFTSNWTCLDEIGSNNATSQSMLEDAITNGVGTSANGVSVGMGSANNILGDSPNGEGNSLSVNMTLANIAGGVN